MKQKTVLCQECRSDEAIHFAELPDPAGTPGLLRYICEKCHFKAVRPPVPISTAFRSPEGTIELLGSMEERETNWASFGKMMRSYQGEGGFHNCGAF